MTARPARAARRRSPASRSSVRPSAVAARLRETAGELWDVDPEVVELDRRARRVRRRGDLVPGPDRQALRLPRRRDHRGRRGPPDRRRYRLLRRGPALLGGLRRRRRGRGRPRHRRRHGPAHGDRRRRRQGDQPAAGRAPGRGRDACRASATRCSRRCGSSDGAGRQRQPARVPRPADRRPARAR